MGAERRIHAPFAEQGVEEPPSKRDTVAPRPRTVRRWMKTDKREKVAVAGGFELADQPFILRAAGMDFRGTRLRHETRGVVHGVRIVIHIQHNEKGRPITKGVKPLAPVRKLGLQSICGEHELKLVAGDALLYIPTKKCAILVVTDNGEKRDVSRKALLAVRRSDHPPECLPVFGRVPVGHEVAQVNDKRGVDLSNRGGDRPMIFVVCPAVPVHDKGKGGISRRSCPEPAVEESAFPLRRYPHAVPIARLCL